MSEAFTFFWKSPLSQWQRAPFVLGGVTFTHAEQAMMVAKAMLFGDRDAAARILAAETPREQQAIGRTVKGFDEAVWMLFREGIVFSTNYARFGQNSEQRDLLLATRGTTLVEASPNDRVWGIGLAADDPRAQDRTQWLGLNLLGDALTRVREALIWEEQGRFRDVADYVLQKNAELYRRLADPSESNSLLRVPTMLRTIFALLLLPAFAAAAEPCISGVSVGQRPGPYSFLVATGPQRGQQTCFICEQDDKPTAVIFARTLSEPLAKLVVKLDAEVPAHKEVGFKVWVTQLSAKADLDALAKWAKASAIKNAPVGAFEDLDGPPAYKLDKSADVTVLLFVKKKVIANFAFRTGELTDDAIGGIVKELPKLFGK